MNKRDIIIIAVLLNTGLLSVLAMMAINTGDDGFESNLLLTNPSMNKLAFEAKVEPEDFAIAQNTTVATDEWDSVLKDYVTSNASQLVIQDEDDFEKEMEPAKKITPEKTIPEKVISQKIISEKPQPEKVITAIEKAPLPKTLPEKILPQKVVSPKPIVLQQPAEKNVIATLPPKAFDNNKIGKTIEITVKRGDALEKIARANGTSVEQVRALNNLKNDRLTIGQTLLMPVQAEKSAIAAVKKEAVAVSQSSVPDEIEYYVIKSGDNPWKIAKQFKVKFDDLLKLNNLDEEKARNLKIGDKIRVK